MTGLPQGWVNTDLGELAEFIMGQAPPGDSYNSDGLGTSLVKAGEFGLTHPVIDGWTTKPLKFAKSSDVLICVVGATAGKINMGADCAIGRSVAAIRPNPALDQEYLFNFLKTRVLDLRNASNGTAQGVISKPLLDAEKIPLPPLAEQRRIVRKLDTLSARSTTARTHLTAIEKLVERYKRLVIGQLCLGGVASQFQDQAEFPELPKGWEWSRAEELCHWITKGTTPSKAELFAGKGDVPFIKVYNLTFSERLDFSVEPTFVGADTHALALKRSKLFPGDVLINIVGPPLGKTAIVPDDFPEWNMNQAIAVFRPKERLFNRFLLYWLSSEWFLLWALSRSKATAGQRNLTLEICRDTPVPLPSFDEQREIVRRIETAFAKIDHLAAEAAKGLKLLGHLDQRILAKAFVGDLVPQDPTDEPAETLLARVRAERSGASKGRRRKSA